MKARAVFDTLNYANRLKAAGMQDKLAETQAEANADMIAHLLDNGLLTKDDLLQSESRTDSKMLAMEARLETKIHEVEKQILQTESRLHQEIKDLETRLTIRLGDKL